MDVVGTTTVFKNDNMNNKLGQRIDDAVKKIWNYHQVHHKVAQDKTFLSSVDGILVFCSSDVGVAAVAARIWIITAKLNLQIHASHQIGKFGNGSETEDVSTTLNTKTPSHTKTQHIVPYLLFSGGIGSGPHSGANLLAWTEPEAVVLSKLTRKIIAASNPELLTYLRILVEDRARNSGENAKFSYELITVKNGLPNPRSLVIVQKPFMERRTLATLQMQWPADPKPELRICSAQLSLDEYIKTTGGNIPSEMIIGIMLGDLQRIKLYAPPHGTFQVAQPIPEEIWTAFEFLAYDEAVCMQHPKFSMNLIPRNSKNKNL